MDKNRGKIKIIGDINVSRIMETGEPLGLFIQRVKAKYGLIDYIAIKNTDGNPEMQAFFDEVAAILWLRKKD